VAVLFLFLGACRGSGGVSDLPTPTPGGTEILVQWFRSGGIAGFCDELTVASDGLAVVRDCKDPRYALNGRRPVPGEEWNLLQSWLATVDAYSDVRSDSAVADQLTVTVVFNGSGVGEASEEEREVLGEFLTQLYTRIRQLADLGCTATTIAPVDVYLERGFEADVVVTVAEGVSLAPLVQTEDGWLGVAPEQPEPGRQLFQMRWLALNAQVTKGEGCDLLPIAPPDVAARCYFSAKDETPVQAAPSDRSATIFLLPPGGFVSVTGRTDAGWLRADLGTAITEGTGWILAPGIDADGACPEFPTVQP
jgi:hypothetical protein